jgi:hypothetical protein
MRKILELFTFARDASAFAIDGLLAFACGWISWQAWKYGMEQYPVIHSMVLNPIGAYNLIMEAPNQLQMAYAYAWTLGSFALSMLLAIVLAVAAVEGLWSALRRI